MAYLPPAYANPYSLSLAKKAVPKRPEQDIHDYLAAEIRAQGTADEAQYTNFTANPPTGPIMSTPKAPPISSGPLTIAQRGVTDVYVLLDSIFKNNADYPNAEVQFLTTQLNSNIAIANVVQMQIGSFYFPRPTWTEPLKSTTPDYLYLRKIYMFIAELPTTSGWGTGANKPYHWEFEVNNINSISVELIPTSPDLYLDSPFSNLSQLTCRFLLGPYMTPLILYKDTISVAYAGAGIFTFTDPSDFSSVSTEYPINTPGVLTTRVGMWVTAFTGAPSIADLTRPQGWFITEMRINGFFVADLAGLAGITFATIQIRKNRFAIPMRFSQAQSISQTGIVPSHH